MRDVATGKDLRLAEARTWSSVILSPDGSTVAFDADPRESSAIYAVAATGGVPKKICAACGRPSEWSPDGTKIFFDARRRRVSRDSRTGRRDRQEQGAPEACGASGQHTAPVAGRAAHCCFPMLLQGRGRRLYVAPYRGTLVPENEWTLIVDSTDLNRQPLWAPSGSLYLLPLGSRWRAVCVGPAH